MSEVATAFVTLMPSARGFGRGISSQIDGDVQRAGRTTGNRFGGALAVGAKGALAPLAGLLAAGAGLGFFKDAVAQASDLSESANKINAIFGDAQAQVNAYAAAGAKALGQNAVAVLDAAATFGTFGKAAGLTGGDLAGFSTELVGLSTDLASFYNTSPEQAVEAIGAALRGESEPIRQYGVLLDDASLRQEALRQGLISTTKQALTPQQKVLAAQALIMKQTADAQGDFARTSGGLANQQRILSAQWTDMKAKVGSALLPAVTGFVSFLNGSALPALERFGALAGPVFSRVASAAKGLFGFFKGGSGAALAEALGVPPDSPLVQFLTVARDAAVVLVDRIRGVVASMKSGDNSFLNGLVNVGRALVPVFAGIAGYFTSTVVPVLRQVGQIVMSAVVPALRAIGSFVVTTLLPALAQFAGFVATQIIPRIVTLAQTVAARIMPAIRALAEAFVTRVVPGLISLGTAILGLVKKAQPFITFVVRIVSLTVGWAARLVGWLVPVLLKLAGPVFSFLIAVIGKVISWVGNIIGWIGSFGNKLLDAREAVVKFATGIRDKIRAVLTFFRELPGKVVDAAKAFATLLVDAGKDLIGGLVSGIKSAAMAPVNAVKDVAGNVASGFKDFFGISSPSRLFAEFGGSLTDGLIVGVRSGLGQVRGAVGELADAASPTGADYLAARVTRLGQQMRAPQLAPGSTAAAGTTVQVINHFPKPEKPSDTVAMGLRRARYAMGAA